MAAARGDGPGSGCGILYVALHPLPNPPSYPIVTVAQIGAREGRARWSRLVLETTTGCLVGASALGAPGTREHILSRSVAGQGVGAAHRERGRRGDEELAYPPVRALCRHPLRQARRASGRGGRQRPRGGGCGRRLRGRVRHPGGHRESPSPAQANASGNALGRPGGWGARGAGGGGKRVQVPARPTDHSDGSGRWRVARAVGPADAAHSDGDPHCPARGRRACLCLCPRTAHRRGEVQMGARGLPCALLAAGRLRSR